MGIDYYISLYNLVTFIKYYYTLLKNINIIKNKLPVQTFDILFVIKNTTKIPKQYSTMLIILYYYLHFGIQYDWVCIFMCTIEHYFLFDVDIFAVKYHV